MHLYLGSWSVGHLGLLGLLGGLGVGGLVVFRGRQGGSLGGSGVRWVAFLLVAWIFHHPIFGVMLKSHCKPTWCPTWPNLASKTLKSHPTSKQLKCAKCARRCSESYIFNGSGGFRESPFRLKIGVWTQHVIQLGLQFSCEPPW